MKSGSEYKIRVAFSNSFTMFTQEYLHFKYYQRLISKPLPPLKSCSFNFGVWEYYLTDFLNKEKLRFGGLFAVLIFYRCNYKNEI